MCDEHIIRHVNSLRGQRLAERERDRQREADRRFNDMVRANQIS